MQLVQASLTTSTMSAMPVFDTPIGSSQTASRRRISASRSAAAGTSMRSDSTGRERASIATQVVVPRKGRYLTHPTGELSVCDLPVERPAVVGHPGTVDTAERYAVRRLRDTRLRPRRAAAACGSPPAAAPRSRRFANCRPACCLRRRRPSCSGCSGCSARPRRRCDRGTERSSRRRNTRGNPMRLRRSPWVPRRIRTPAQLQPGSS